MGNVLASLFLASCSSLTLHCCFVGFSPQLFDSVVRSSMTGLQAAVISSPQLFKVQELKLREFLDRRTFVPSFIFILQRIDFFSILSYIQEWSFSHKSILNSMRKLFILHHRDHSVPVPPSICLQILFKILKTVAFIERIIILKD